MRHRLIVRDTLAPFPPLPQAPCRFTTNLSSMESEGGTEPLRGIRRGLLAAAGALVLAGVLGRAGMTSGALAALSAGLGGRPARRVLRVWDWWAPSTNE